MVPKCQSRGHDLVRDFGSDLVIGRSLDRSNFAAALRNRLRTHFTPPRSTFDRKNPYTDIPAITPIFIEFLHSNSRVICFGERRPLFFFQLSAFPFSCSNPYQHWPSTQHTGMTFYLVHRLALLFQVGRHHGRLDVPSSFKVAFYLRKETFALSPSLAHIITFAHANCLPYCSPSWLHYKPIPKRKFVSVVFIQSPRFLRHAVRW